MPDSECWQMPCRNMRDLVYEHMPQERNQALGVVLGDPVIEHPDVRAFVGQSIGQGARLQMGRSVICEADHNAW